MAFAFVAALSGADASAQQFGAPGVAGAGFPWMPYGFYQPYGAHYGNSLRTPPTLR